MKLKKQNIIDFIIYKYRVITLYKDTSMYIGPNGFFPLRRYTGILRVVPNFFIIGCARCGTLTLWEYLMRHPNFFRPAGRESGYFTLFCVYGKSLTWYKNFYPSIFLKFFIKHVRKRKFITGESDPYYLFHPNVPERIYNLFPNTKLIVLLRNPVDRAYSHYHLNKRRGREKITFEEAIEKEKIRLDGEVEKLLNDKNYYSRKHQRYAYLSRGIYIDQLKNWNKYFSKEQMLIIKSEDLYSNPEAVVHRVFKFLDQPIIPLKKLLSQRRELYKEYGSVSGKKQIHTHKQKYPKMNEKTREKLTEYFRSYNYALYKYLNVNFNWEGE